MRLASVFCTLVTSAVLFASGTAAAQNRLTPSQADAAFSSGPQTIAPIPRYRMTDPMFKASGRIVDINQAGVVVEDKKGRRRLYLCCDRRTEFEAKKKSRLAERKEIFYPDFELGDRVDVYYEGLHMTVVKLRLVPAKDHFRPRQLEADAR